MSVPRVTTGIPKLDEALGGGFPEGNIVLVAGQAGAGKSLFGMQFLFKNALKKIPGAYFTFEEPPEDLKIEGGEIGLDFGKTENLDFVKLTPFDYNDVISKLTKELDKRKIKVAVLDNITTLASFSESYTSTVTKELDLKDEEKITGKAAIKAMLYDLAAVFKQRGVTVLWLSELPNKVVYYSRDTESEFIADGIILMTRLTAVKNFMRTLSVEKMRKTKHALNRFPIEITPNGLVLKPVDDAVSR